MTCFQLPMIARDIASGDGESIPQFADDPLVLEPVLAQAKKSGANALIAPTDCLIIPVLEEVGRDEEIQDLSEGIISAVIKSAGDMTVGAALLPNRLGETDNTVAAFEDEHIAYLEKLTAFRAAGADFAVVKHHSTLSSMRAAVMAAKVAGLPVMVIMDCDDEGKSRSGADYLACLITLQALGADSFCICPDCGAEGLRELIHTAFPHAEIPIGVMTDLSKLSEDELKGLCFDGASVFIDTSGALSEEGGAIIRKYANRFSDVTEKDSHAAAVYCEAFFLPDDLELSEPLDCSYDISDELIDMDDENIGAVCVELHSTDEAAVLAESAYMSRLPLCVLADDTTTLEAALRYFQGRLIIDTRCDLPEDELNALTEKYGAILY